MMVSGIRYGGVTAAWQQYQYWHMATSGAAARAAAATASVSGQAGSASARAITPVSGQAGSAAATGAATGAAASGVTGRGPTPPEMPYIPEGYGPEELATRTRIQFPGLGVPPEEWAEAQALLPWAAEDTGEGISGVKGDEAEDIPAVEDKESAAEVAEDAKCETCEKRKYQDGSDDPGVSFKTATRVAPETAQAAVRGHEMEHVVREQAKAKREGRKVVSQSVTYHTGICPECGKIYISGGTTRTVTAANNAAENKRESLRKRFSGKTLGTSLDATA